MTPLALENLNTPPEAPLRMGRLPRPDQITELVTPMTPSVQPSAPARRDPRTLEPLG